MSDKGVQFIAGTYYAKGIIEGRKEAAAELEMLLSGPYADERYTAAQRLEVVQAWIEGMKAENDGSTSTNPPES